MSVAHPASASEIQVRRVTRLEWLDPPPPTPSPLPLPLLNNAIAISGGGSSNNANSNLAPTSPTNAMTGSAHGGGGAANNAVTAGAGSSGVQRALSVGGYVVGSAHSTNAVAEFDFASKVWSSVGIQPFPYAVSEASMVCIRNKFFVYGGWDDQFVRGDIHVLDTAGNNTNAAATSTSPAPGQANLNNTTTPTAMGSAAGGGGGGAAAAAAAAALQLQQQQAEIRNAKWECIFRGSYRGKNAGKVMLMKPLSSGSVGCKSGSFPEGSFPKSRRNAAMTTGTLGNRTVFFIFGGYDGHRRLNDLWAFDIDSYEWIEIKSNSPSAPAMSSTLASHHQHNAVKFRPSSQQQQQHEMDSHHTNGAADVDISVITPNGAPPPAAALMTAATAATKPHAHFKGLATLSHNLLKLSPYTPLPAAIPSLSADGKGGGGGGGTADASNMTSFSGTPQTSPTRQHSIAANTSLNLVAGGGGGSSSSPTSGGNSSTLFSTMNAASAPTELLPQQQQQQQQINNGGSPQSSSTTTTTASSSVTAVIEPSATAPCPRDGTVLVFDHQKSRLFVFGGYGDAPLNDVYELKLDANIPIVARRYNSSHGGETNRPARGSRNETEKGGFTYNTGSEEDGEDDYDDERRCTSLVVEAGNVHWNRIHTVNSPSPRYGCFGLISNGSSEAAAASAGGGGGPTKGASSPSSPANNNANANTLNGTLSSSIGGNGGGNGSSSSSNAPHLIIGFGRDKAGPAKPLFYQLNLVDYSWTICTLEGTDATANTPSAFLPLTEARASCGVGSTADGKKTIVFGGQTQDGRFIYSGLEIDWERPEVAGGKTGGKR